MPQILYSEAEYLALQRELLDTAKQRDAAQAMRPQWAQGHSSDSVAAQVKAAALQQVWDLLRVSDQTSCIQTLKNLIEDHRINTLYIEQIRSKQP